VKISIIRADSLPIFPVLLDKNRMMRYLRHVQSESSLEPLFIPKDHPNDWTRKQSKQHQAQAPCPNSVDPANLEQCEKLADQNSELQKILREQEEQIENLQENKRVRVPAIESRFPGSRFGNCS
jgi:predicted RNase H-like nuclease (RuvC/YqgF family)